jgi:hypothetical protein
MARDQDPRTARLFDRRTVERNIKKGLITRKDYEKHLKSLEDVGEKGVYGGTDSDEPDDDDDTDTVAEAADEGGAEPGTNSQGH